MIPSQTIPALADLPPEALEPLLEDAARCADLASRQRLLAEADALRAGDASARRRALATYRAFRASLTAGRAADAARILWVFENDARRDAAVGDLASATASGDDPDVKGTATLVLGQVAAEAGRTDQAEGLLRGLLVDRRGTGHRLERLACLALSRLFAQRRRGFEALALARMAASLARKAGSAWDLCAARARVCMALDAMGDAERLATALEELDRGLEGIPRERARPLRLMVLGFRAESALAGDDLEGARRALEGLRALRPDGDAAAADPRLASYLEAEIALRDRRPDEAAALVRRARDIPSPVAASDLPLAILEARCLVEQGDRDRARAVLAGVLDVLDADPESDPLGPGQRIRWSMEAGRILQDRCGDVAAARRAFDLAAGQVAGRIAEIDRGMAEMPELSGMSEEDLAALTAHRDRFARQQVEILDRVAALFRGEAPPAGLIHGEEPGEEGFFRACAWCRRVRGGSGRWLPIGEFLPEGRRLRISHGICGDCHRRISARPARD